MKNIERMTKLLEQEAREKAGGVVLEARQEAQRILKTGRMQAKEKKQEILAQYELTICQEQERMQSEQRAEESNLLLAAKQSLMEEVLTRVLSTQRGVSDEMRLLKRVFPRSVERARGEIPTVLVPHAYLEAARKALGQDIVVEAGDFESGFILRFTYFDDNFERNALFRFWREEIEALAAVYLFSGDDDEKAEP